MLSGINPKVPVGISFQGRKPKPTSLLLERLSAPASSEIPVQSAKGKWLMLAALVGSLMPQASVKAAPPMRFSTAQQVEKAIEIPETAKNIIDDYMAVTIASTEVYGRYMPQFLESIRTGVQDDLQRMKLNFALDGELNGEKITAEGFKAEEKALIRNGAKEALSMVLNYRAGMEELLGVYGGDVDALVPGRVLAPKDEQSQLLKSLFRQSLKDYSANIQKRVNYYKGVAKEQGLSEKEIQELEQRMNDAHPKRPAIWVELRQIRSASFALTPRKHYLGEGLQQAVDARDSKVGKNKLEEMAKISVIEKNMWLRAETLMKTLRQSGDTFTQFVKAEQIKDDGTQWLKGLSESMQENPPFKTVEMAQNAYEALGLPKNFYETAQVKWSYPSQITALVAPLFDQPQYRH